LILTQFVQNESNNILVDYSLWKSEIKDSNVIRHGREKAERFYYKVPALPLKWYVLFEGRLVINVYGKL